MDATSHALLETANLYARSGVGGVASEDRPPVYKVVGIVLAVSSGLFIGVSFVVKKIGLLKANVKYDEEAGEGYGYLKNAWWWTGMTLMIIGEVCNFAAYMFVDAILVTPLGALSVVVTTILSAIFLKEKLSFVGKMSCGLAILGSVIIALNAPEQSAVSDIQSMQKFVISPGFLSYTGVVILGCAFTAIWVAPRYGKKTMMVYISICSLIGGLSVVATQGLGAAIIAQINGKAQFNKWFTYVLLVFVVCTLLTEIIYLNVSLHALKQWYYANQDTESTQSLQRCASHTHLLRFLHIRHHRFVRYSFPRFQGHSHFNHDCRHGFPSHLCWCRSAATG
jgi:drug/metabolite transporter (DMT)-like permease